MTSGKLFVISGPSGVGKGTLVKRILDQLPQCVLSISATTRRPRMGETDGVDYYFLSPEQFDALVAEDAFLEWASYNGNSYGTPRKAVESSLARGKNVICEIDPQGAFQICSQFPEAVLIFIAPPSLEELKRRLKQRGSETLESLDKRMAIAEVELSQQMRYDAVLVNDDLDKAVGDLTAYINEMCASKEA